MGSSARPSGASVSLKWVQQQPDSEASGNPGGCGHTVGDPGALAHMFLG